MTTLLTPAYRLTFGANKVDTMSEPKASATVDLVVTMDMEDWPDSAAIRLGQVGGLDAALEDSAAVDLGYADNGGVARVFTGLVDALRTGLLERRVTLASAARALARLRLDQTYEGQTAGAIVSDLAGRAKVPLGAVDDGISFPSYVVDFRRTALAHIQELAALSGTDAYVDSDGKLVFQAFTTGQAIHDVGYAKQILSLDVDRGTEADATVQAFGESPVGNAGAEAWGWLTKDFSRAEGKAGSGSRPVVLERPALRTAAAAATAASARLRAIQRRAVRGTVLMPGRPEVKLGDAIAIQEVPTASLNDRYQVRRVVHRITKDGGFTTLVGFTAIPSAEFGMSSIVETIQRIVQNELRALRVAELGVVEAISPHSDSGDNDNYGCDVRLRNTGLLLKRVPVMTSHLGSAAIPNIGDLVLLTFEKGDVNQGIVLGRLYTDDDRPPVNAANELIMHLPLHAEDSSAIQTAIRNIGDNSPPREIIVQMAPKITVRITDGTVRATAGNSELTLDQPDGGGGTVTVLAGGTKITMDQDGDVVVQAVGDVTIEAGGSMTLSAAEGLTLRAGTSIDLQAGSSLSMQATAEASVEAAGSLSLQAAIIAVGGITSFAPG